MNSICEKATSSLAEHHQDFEPPPENRQQHALMSATMIGLVILTSWLLLYRRQLVDYCDPPSKTIHFSLDINSAPPSELSLLPGIGTTMADRIIETRKKHGPFTSIDDIVSVPGIGNITLQEIRPFVQTILTLPTEK